MQVERPLYLSPIERELRFSSWTKRNNIDQILFDFDDTICATGNIFREHKNQVSNHVLANNPSIDPKQFEIDFTQADNDSFETNAVNPNRFDFMSDTLCDKYNLNQETRQTIKDIFQDIYQTPIPFLDGAQETLKFLKKIEIPIGIVTHGNRHWTYQKYQWLDLQRFLNWEDVFVVDQDNHKTSQSWAEALKYFRCQPQNCLVTGDSPRSDINPACEIGVKHCFLVEKQSVWSVHRQPINSTVRTIKNISEIIQFGCEQL